MQTIVNLGTGGADLNGQNGSTTSADSNDALFLDWPGDNAGNYVYLPGVAGNFLSVPDEAALDITGDIDIRVRVALDDWTPGAATALVSKYNTSGQYSYELGIAATNYLRFQWSENGTTENTVTCDTALDVSDESPLWVRVTHDVDNGSSQNEVKWWQSSDGITWTQVGSTFTSSGTTSHYASTSSVNLLARTTSTRLGAGKVYRAQVLDGIDGTPVLDVDCSQITSGSATSFTALTGQTVTINRSTSGRKSVAVVSPVWLLGTDDYMQVADNALLDFGASDDFTVVAVTREFANLGGAKFMVSKVSGTTSTDAGYGLRSSGGTPSESTLQMGDGSAGNSTAITTGRVAGETTVIAAVRDATASTITGYRNGVVDTSVSDPTSGDIANALPLRIGVRSGSLTSYADMEIVSIAVYPRILAATEIAAISTYYANRWP